MTNDTTIKDYSVTGFRDRDFTEISRLFSIAFNGRELNEELWKWRVLKNPVNKVFIVNAWDGSKLIGHTMLSPTFAYYNGKRVLTACSGTTMAHPDYPGMFVRLSEACSRMYPEIELIFGFPNKNSFRISTKYLKHRHIGDICFWTKEPERLNYCSSVVGITGFTDEHELLTMHEVQKHIFIIERSKAYLNWRLAGVNGRSYSLYEYRDEAGVHGYMALNEYSEDGARHGQIIDILAEDDRIFCRMIRSAESLFAEKGCSLMKLWMTSGKYHTLLSEMNFMYGRNPFHMVVWDRDADLAEMYVTMASSDVF